MAGSAGFKSTFLKKRESVGGSNRMEVVEKKRDAKHVLGLVQFTAMELFRKCAGARQKMFITMTFVELYNGKLFDLLAGCCPAAAGEGGGERGEKPPPATGPAASSGGQQLMRSNGSAGSGGLRRSVANGRGEIKLLEDGRANVQVLGLNSVRVGSPAEVEMLLEKGSKARATDAMHQNDQSSRSSFEKGGRMIQNYGPV